MSGQLPLATKKFLSFVAIFAVSLLITGLLCASGFIRYGDGVLYDICINRRVLHNTEIKNIATIDLDDESIEVLGEAIDTHRAFADILEVLDDANAAVVLDFMLKTKKSDDDAFVAAVKRTGNTVMAALAVDTELMIPPNSPYRALTETERGMLERHIWHIKVMDKGKVPQPGTFLLPSPALVEAAAQIGHVNMYPDADGRYRRAPLLYEWEGGYIPSLALAAAVLKRSVPFESMVLKAGAYLAIPLMKNPVSEEDFIKIPIDEQGRMLIPYTEPWAGAERRIPFHSVVGAKDDDAAFDEFLNDLNGRIALVAEVSTSQKDFGPTSFERLYPLSGIHAELINGIAKGIDKRAFIRWSSLFYKLVVLLLIVSVAHLIIRVKKDILFHLGFLAALIIFAGFTLFRWQSAAISPWFAFPVSLLCAMWTSALVSRLFLRYREQLLLRNALSRYFPHALAERIMREGKTELIPAYKELTILFSDISGFTKWSSDKSPENVHLFLNDYLESMAEILFSYGGTVDKFMGDGILSFFGDPLDMPGHTEQCINAAIAMQKKITVLAEKWKPLVDIDLKVRIGINTGKVIVGNLGNKTRIEYTVIGAAVNLAQRMESNAPVGGILVTANVWEKVKDKFSFPEKRDVTVKGYAETIEAYVVGF